MDNNANTGRYPFQDPALPLELRIADILSQLTLEEKIGQLVNTAPAVERLGIPAYNWWNEGLHGVARAGVATVFPQAIGLAATWDPDLMHRVATAISDEARAKHHEFLRQGIHQIYTGLTYWSPNINIARDPRWGRAQETYGEDPYLTARMAVAFVRGLQGNDPRYLKLVATPKHFAVHSGPERLRHGFNAEVSERDLRETYLPAFEACVREAQAYSIMGAYNRVNGEACCASPVLLEKILRAEWGFDGYVVSDCGAIADIFRRHLVVQTAEEAAALAVRTGCDLNCCDRGCPQDVGALYRAVEARLIAPELIDRAVARLFRARFRLGMFDPPDQVSYAQIPYEVNDSPAHRMLALQAARESIVLLKNQDELLPLPRDIASIAVIGPNADDLSVLRANYFGGAVRPVTPLKGIRQTVAHETRVYYARGCPIAPGVPLLETIPSTYLRPANVAADINGLTAAYYANANFEGVPDLIRIEPIVDHRWKFRSPFGGQPTDPFSVIWVGLVIPPVTGLYSLGANGSSDFRLWLDDRVIIPFELNDHEPCTRTVEVELQAGRLYEIQLEYLNAGRDPQVRLLWSMPDQDYMAQALQVAQQAQAVIMVLGLSPEVEGEEMRVQVPGFVGGDRMDIALPSIQQELLAQVHALGKPVVLVLLNGSALAINWAQENVPAIIEAWYPGQEGGTALAEVLFGDYNPAGRLPVTFYQSVDQLPPFEDYRMAGRTYRYMTDKPLYPFGHGLSYTTFEYSSLDISPARISAEGEVRVTVDIRNIGDRAGEEVVQLYVRYPESRVPRPIVGLKGFQRLSLAPGEMQHIMLTLAAKQLAFWDNGFVVEPGRVQVLVGASSADIRLTSEFTIEPEPVAEK
ncbi:MAG: glycoside hydrolase family 3 C-terminal domain-containing protein [Anaerolineae bacterium]